MTQETLAAENGLASGRPPRWVMVALLLLLTLGVFSLVAGIMQEDSTRTWAAFLVNFVFWISIAHFGVIFAAILSLSHGRWGSAYVRLAQSLAAFLPLSFVLFVIFIVGGSGLFSWVREPIPEKALWLNYPFMAVRDGFGLLVLLALSLAFLFYSLRPDAWRLKGRGGPWAQRLYRVMTANFGDWPTEVEHCRRRITVLAPAVMLIYCFVFSLLAGDLIMSLSPYWYSSLFGAYYFIGSIYLGLAALAVLSGVLRKPLGLDAFITDDHRHDLGKLLFAFCLISVDMFWSQFLVIWYGNIPEEAFFIAVRTQQQPWLTLSWIVLMACFALPFVLLLGRAGKRNSKYLSAVALLIVVGYWNERVLLIVPSVSPSFSLGWVEITLAGGFFALFALTVIAFLCTFPILPVESD